MFLNFVACACHTPSTFFLSSVMLTQPIDWTTVPHTELVSNSEDDAEVAEAKAGEKQ